MNTPLSARPIQRSFPIGWVSMDDLLACCPAAAEAIAQFTETDLEYIAAKVGDALQESYWIALETVLTSYMNIPECVDDRDSIDSRISDS